MSMKRIMLICMMILCLVPVGGWAAEETAPALYAIRENGLWGYMNQAGKVVIEPQWFTAGAFSDGWALVESEEGMGLIDSSGAYAIQPSDRIQIEEYPHAYTVYDYELEGYGFFDKASGFYQEPLADYEMIFLWGEDGKGPIPVQNKDYLTGYVSRTTGETVIPFRYTGESEDIAFNEGYALAANLTWLDEGEVWREVLPDSEPIPDNDGEIRGEGFRYYLIDTAGKAVKFPEGLEPYTGVCHGVLVVHPDPSMQQAIPEDQEEDIEAETDTPYLYDSFGIGRPDGTVVLEPQPLYYLWRPDSEGMLCYVDSALGNCGHMNLNGEVIVSAKYRIDTGGSMPSYTYVNGYAVINDIGDHWPDSERWVILDTAGNEVFTRPTKAEDGTTFRVCGDVVLENRLFWCEEAGGYSLMRLTDHGAERISDTAFEASLGCHHDEYGKGIEFSEGLHPVEQNGLWGYIDEQAQWVILPQYDSTANFRDSRALVEKDGKLMYIDRSGAVVWEERCP